MTTVTTAATPTYRILLLGDYSNMHSQLGRTLSQWGHEVTVASMGSGFQDTVRDIDIRRGRGRVGGLVLSLRLLCGSLHRHLRDYDIVALQNPNFLPLRPRRLRYFFDRLCGENRRVFLSAAGADPLYIKECLDMRSPLAYNEYRVERTLAPYAVTHRQKLHDYITPEMCDYCDHVYDNIDGAVTALYEYDIAVRRRLGDDKTAYGGIPIDVDALKPVTIPRDVECVKIFLGRHRERQSEKGTDLLEQAARRVIDRLKDRASLEIVENIPYAAYVNSMCNSHILLDQIYSYSPATNAMIAMAHGLNVVTGGESDYYDFIGERDNRPIINAPTNLAALSETLADVCAHPEALSLRGERSRAFVCKHNAAETVARRYLAFWTSKLT